MESTWKALADPVRRRILDLLREEPRTTGEICGSVAGLSRFGVMSHIAILKDAGFIQVEKRGRERINRLDVRPLRQACDGWIRPYEDLWAGRLDRLKGFVETHEQENAMRQTKRSSPKLVTFSIERTVDIAGSRPAVFAALTTRIGEWWGAPYLTTGKDARDVVLEPRLGGHFKEITASGDGIIWGTVQVLLADRAIETSGRMMVRGAIAGSVRFELEDADGGTRLTLVHRAVGHMKSETESEFAAGWKDLLGNRLRAFVERGERKGLRRAA